MNPINLPVARELFAQWQRARGGRADVASRPFSRGWEDLLGDARIVSAIDRSEAEYDIRELAAQGWTELKTVRYKSHLIDRIVIPLAQEQRWCEAFGFVPPSDEEARQIREFRWVPELAFVRDANLNLPFSELSQLNQFILSGGMKRPVVPIKERSLQIFGEEKRLDSLLSSVLFRAGRIDLLAHLRCEMIGVPLAWRRGPSNASQQPLIVIENAATWHSYSRWNEIGGFFSGVVYGDGNRFMDGVPYLADILKEVGASRAVFYFGDLDPQGLRIPQEASMRAQVIGLPVIKAHLWSYRQLLSLGSGRGQPSESDPASSTLCDWLGEISAPVRQLFANGHRLAQEHVGWEFLNSCHQVNLETT
jgi:Uncharacterized protein conserved in bacteria C-term(DUF2220)